MDGIFDPVNSDVSMSNKGAGIDMATSLLDDFQQQINLNVQVQAKKPSLF